MEFIRKNVNVLENIIPKIAAKNTEAIFLIVTNPVDILTYAALKYIEIPESRIIGIGTILDTARVKYLVGKKLNVDPRNVHGFVVGEHGKSEVAIWSSARVSGVPLRDFFEMRGYPDPDEFLEGVSRKSEKMLRRSQLQKGRYLLRRSDGGPQSLRSHYPR